MVINTYNLLFKWQYIFSLLIRVFLCSITDETFTGVHYMNNTVGVRCDAGIDTYLWIPMEIQKAGWLPMYSALLLNKLCFCLFRLYSHY